LISTYKYIFLCSIKNIIIITNIRAIITIKMVSLTIINLSWNYKHKYHFSLSVIVKQNRDQNMGNLEKLE